VSESISYADNAGFQAWNMSKGISTVRGYAHQARELLAGFETREGVNPDQVTEARRLVGEIERSAAGADVVWQRIEAALAGAGVTDPPVDGVTVLRNRGADPPLTAQLREIWADFGGRTAPLTLLGQLEEITGPGDGPTDQIWSAPDQASA
jgi:hypothetical protein